MVIRKEIKGKELYLYMNGNIIYKRWLDTGQSFVFDVMAYNKYTLASIRDLSYDYPNDLIIVKAKLSMKTTEQGGRRHGFISGYRPDHVFENDDSKVLQAYIGDIIFEGQSTIEPGEEKVVTIRFLNHQHIEKYLNIGRVWWIHEAGRCLGEAEIIDILV